MTSPVRPREFNNFLQFIYEHLISTIILVSILLYLLWNLTRFIFSVVLTESQRSVAITLQEFFNSVLITLIIVFFVFNIQRREFSYFEHLSLVSNGIIKTTSNPYKIIYANQQLLDLLNYSEETIINKELISLCVSGDQMKLFNFIKQPSIESIKNIELELATSDDRTTPVLLSISRVYSMFTKKEKGLFIVINDIRNLRESQKQIEHLMVVEKESILNSFVQKVGHEINNPLSFMMYDSERLIDYVQEMIGMLRIYDEVEKKLKLESEKPEIIENMVRIEKIKQDMNYDSAISDLEDILTATREGISRIAKVVKEVRTFPLQGSEKHRQSINSVLKLTIDLVKGYYLRDKPNIVIKSNLDISIPEIPLKAGEIAQIILNMLLNSIQAIEEIKDCGKITVETKLLKNTQHDLDENQIIELTIEDDGIGIRKEDFSKIFDPYFTTKKEGTGLGLSNVKKVIEEHNGTINIQSERKKGTKIAITLPAY